jgi:MFS family permease
MQLSRPAFLVLCTTVLVLTSASLTAFSLFLPFIEREFGWTRAMATLPYAVTMVAWGLSAPILGKLADDYGTRPIILGGIALMATGFLGMAFAQNLWQLVLCFGVLVGIAMGGASIVLMALLVAKRFDAPRRAFAVSVVQTASPLYPLLFAPILFLIVRTFDWRTAALVTSAQLWFIALPLAWLGVRDPDTARLASRQRAPWSACLPYFRDPTMLALIAARFACGLAFFQSAHLVAMSLNKGFDPVVGTTALSILGAASIAWVLTFGRLADRFGRARMLGLSYALRGVGTVAMATFVTNEWGFYLLVALAIGPTFATIALGNVLFFEAVGPRLAGAMLGLSFVVHQTGAAIGPQLGSVVYDLTHSYEGYQLGIGLVLLVSAALTFHLQDPGARAAERTAPAGTAPTPAPAG